MNEAKRIAAIDIGGDTVHMLIGSIDGTGDDQVVKGIEQRSELIELGRRVALKGRVNTHAAAEVSRLVLSYVAVARKKADHVVIAATAALRQASNGTELVAALGEKAGVPVRILSGRREAELGFMGAARRLNASGPQLLIDSGGASTELTMTDGRTLVSSATLPVGAASLGTALRGDPPSALSWAMGGAQVGLALSLAPAGKPARALATGGSAHNLAGLERTKGTAGKQEVTLDHLSDLAADLLSLPFSKLARRSGEDPRRVAILPPGLLIISGVLMHYGLDRVTVILEGLREGMILAAASQGDDWWRDGKPTPRPRRATPAKSTKPA